MSQWIENNAGKMIFFFLIIFSIEIGIGVWRLPPKLRNEMIPILQANIYQYDTMINKLNETSSYLKEYVISNDRRVDLLLDIGEQSMKVQSLKEGYYPFSDPSSNRVISFWDFL